MCMAYGVYMCSMSVHYRYIFLNANNDEEKENEYYYLFSRIRKKKQLFFRAILCIYHIGVCVCVNVCIKNVLVTMAERE